MVSGGGRGCPLDHGPAGPAWFSFAGLLELTIALAFPFLTSRLLTRAPCRSGLDRPGHVFGCRRMCCSLVSGDDGRARVVQGHALSRGRAVPVPLQAAQRLAAGVLGVRLAVTRPVGVLLDRDRVRVQVRRRSSRPEVAAGCRLDGRPVASPDGYRQLARDGRLPFGRAAGRAPAPVLGRAGVRQRLGAGRPRDAGRLPGSRRSSRAAARSRRAASWSSAA